MTQLRYRCLMKMLMPLVTAAILSFTVVGYTQKPVQEGQSSMLYREPPATLRELSKASQAVLVVKIISERGVDAVIGMHRIFTEVTASIVDVVKPSSQVGPVGAEIVFKINGGEIDRGDHVERIVARSQPRLMVGRDYVIAVNWEESESAFFPSYGPGSIFEIDGAVVTPQRKTQLAEKTKGMSLDQLLTALRAPASK